MDIMKAMVLAALPNPNRQYIKHDGYAISFNPLTDTGPETALVVYKTKDCKGMEANYFILLGDHRKAYAKCECLADCKKYFHDNETLQSPWSE